MTNHYHLLVETPDSNLSKGMRHLNGVYTQRFNRKHSRVGHVFQGRYKAILVEKDAYLQELSRYMVKARGSGLSSCCKIKDLTPFGTPRYLYGPGIDQPILIENASGNRYFYHFDRQGSVVALSDGITGNLTEQYAYGPYGESSTVISITGNSFRFTGRRLDEETGLYYYRARYYDPTLGRFLQTDPIGYEDQMNLYAYVYNDPINFLDPLGLGGVAAQKGQEPGFFERAGDELRNLLGVDGGVDPTSTEYGVGYLSGFTATSALVTRNVSLGLRSQGPLRVINQNRYLRVGYGSHAGRSTFRVGGRVVERTTGRRHIDLGDGGPL